MNKLLILAFVLIVTGCSYQPWHYERYVPDSSSEVEARIKDDTSLFSIDVSPTRYNPELAKGPYKVNFRYVDNTMELKQLNICNLSISTDQGKSLYSSNICQKIDFVTPSYSEGVEPYANLASYSIADIQPAFHAGEKVLVKFTYNTEPKSTGKAVSLVFVVILDKGNFVPCCLPSV